MRILFLYLIISQTFTFSYESNHTAIERSKSLHTVKKIYRSVPFISHNNPERKYGTYLARNILFEPISKILRYIELKRNLKLKHRGEAHITLLTPPEYERISQWNPSVNMANIDGLVSPLIQYLHFNILGIGSLEGTNTKSQQSEVFFLVIKSRGLRAIRKLIAAEWSIPKSIFDPMAQDFHITIGFTVSDLFPRKGFDARKNAATIQTDLNLY